MKWQRVKSLSESSFRRLTGIKMKTFDAMVDVVGKAYIIKHARGGRPHSLCIQDMILMTLEYWREYRTYYHIGESYGLAESNAFQTIKWVEDVLVESKVFALPPKTELMAGENKDKRVVIDVFESPIERPKKNKNCTTRERKSDILIRHSYL